MPTTYIVNHDFQAEENEEGELSVQKGTIVVSVDSSGDGDGWIEVYIHSDRSRRGYVPESYLKEYQPPSATSATVSSQAKVRTPPQSTNFGSPYSNTNIAASSSPNTYSSTYSSSVPLPTANNSNVPNEKFGNVTQMETSIPPANSTKLGPIRRLSDPRLPDYLQEVGGSTAITKVSKAVSPVENKNPPKMPNPSQNINDEFSNLIALHDDWLKNMQSAHQDAFRGMVSDPATPSTPLFPKNSPELTDCKPII